MHPPNPRPEATVCAETRGNIAELAATVIVALLASFAFASNSGVQRRAGQVAEGPSSEPTIKNYGLHGWLRITSQNWRQ